MRPVPENSRGVRVACHRWVPLGEHIGCRSCYVWRASKEELWGGTTFDTFIEQQTARPAATCEVDWEKQREEWLQHLDQFYQLVEGTCANRSNRTRCAYSAAPKRLHEEFLGDYSVDTMILDIGRNRVVFDPVGNLIGAKGRVDMQSAKGTVKLVLVPADATSREGRPLTGLFRDLHHDRRTRVSLEGDILKVWRQAPNVPTSMITALTDAFKYRHWLAHGRYWTPKFQKLGYDEVYSLAQATFEAFPLRGA